MGLKDPDIFVVAPIRCFEHNKLVGEATGFFYYSDRLYFITNRHVLIEEEKNYYPDEIRLLLHKKENILKSKMFPISLYDSEDKNLWLEHPLHGKDIDIIALPIDERILGSQFAISALSKDDIIPSHIDLSIGEEILVIGYPLGFHDTVHNLPIARNASISSVYPIPFEGRPGFLIDSRLHSGTSGSPVLSKLLYTMRTTNGDIIRKHPPPRFLLGVHSETLDTLDRDPNIDEPLGLNFVWFANLIPEIIQASDYNVKRE